MEYHFNNILDILSDWRTIIKEDIPLSEAIQMAHKEYVAQEQFLIKSIFDRYEASKVSKDSKSSRARSVHPSRARYQ